jgi:type VI secretion system protein ImpA
MSGITVTSCDTKEVSDGNGVLSSALMTDPLRAEADVPEMAVLLAPIPGDCKAGADLREDHAPDAVYQLLRGARTLARNQERTALANGEIQYFAMSAWQEVLTLAPLALAEHTKDLEICAWYIEALARQYGFRGLAFGFILAARLISDYGDQLYPVIDEEGVATQLAPLVGLNGYGADGPLIATIKSIPLTVAMPPGPLTTWQCEQTFEVNRIENSDKRAAKLKQGVMSQSDLDKHIAEIPDDYLLEMANAIQQAMESYDLLQSAIDTHCLSEPQPTQKIQRVLAVCQQTLTYLAGDRIKRLRAQGERAETSPAEVAATGECNDKSDTLGQQTGTGDDVMTLLSSDWRIEEREAALMLLEKVGDYFRRAEPHSPISYSIEQIMHWSTLPLTDLIQQLIPDDGARKQFRNLVGIMADK